MARRRIRFSMDGCKVYFDLPPSVERAGLKGESWVDEWIARNIVGTSPEAFSHWGWQEAVPGRFGDWVAFDTRCD
jgi:hypothetical protein